MKYTEESNDEIDFYDNDEPRNKRLKEAEHEGKPFDEKESELLVQMYLENRVNYHAKFKETGRNGKSTQDQLAFKWAKELNKLGLGVRNVVSVKRRICDMRKMAKKHLERQRASRTCGAKVRNKPVLKFVQNLAKGIAEEEMFGAINTIFPNGAMFDRSEEMPRRPASAPGMVTSVDMSHPKHQQPHLNQSTNGLKNQCVRQSDYKEPKQEPSYDATAEHCSFRTHILEHGPIEQRDIERRPSGRNYRDQEFERQPSGRNCRESEFSAFDEIDQKSDVKSIVFFTAANSTQNTSYEHVRKGSSSHSKEGKEADISKKEAEEESMRKELIRAEIEIARAKFALITRKQTFLDLQIKHFCMANHMEIPK